MGAGLDKRDVDVENIVEVKRKPTPMMPINSPGSDHTGTRSSRAINIPGDWSLVVIETSSSPKPQQAACEASPYCGNRDEYEAAPVGSIKIARIWVPTRLPGFGFQSASAADARTASTLNRLHAWPAVVEPLMSSVFFCRAKNVYGPSRRWRPSAVMSVAGDLGHRQTVAIDPSAKWSVHRSSRG